MEFLHASIALLASMVLVLAGMVGWLYWQQTRLFQNMNSIVMVIGELTRPQYVEEIPAPPVEESPSAPPTTPMPEEDDRVSVEEEAPSAVEHIEGPPGPIDVDSLTSKSAKELKEMLTKRGIPFGPRDTKNALVSLLKATA
jgi:hypothetical protein